MTDCIFCKIIKGSLPGKFVYRDKDVVVFHDINPKAPIHVLVVPVKHIPAVSKVEVKDKQLLGKLFLTIRKVTEKLAVAQKGYKLVVNTGKAAGQLVDHLHIHILAGWTSQRKWQV